MAQPDKKTVRLRECECSPDLKVDADGSCLLNVRVLGLESQNRRRYLPEAAVDAVGKYEGLRVMIDHPQSNRNPNETRPVKSLFGVLEGVTADNGLRADRLRYNPAHPMAPVVKWWAENYPDKIGLSHNAVGQGRTEAGTFLVEKIVSVRSVDLVTDPATTKGLFESMGDYEDTDLGPEEGEGYEAKIGHLIVAVLHDKDLDLKAKREKILKALKLMDGDEEEEETPEEEEEEEGPGKKPDEEMESVQALAKTNPAVKSLLERLDTLEAKDRLAAKRERAEALIAEARLPREAVTEVFLETVLAAPSEKAMKSLIEDRKQVAGVRRPRSGPSATGPGGTPPRSAPAPKTNSEFAAAVRGRK